MKSYVIRAGSQFTLVHETADKTTIAPKVATCDLSFHDKELVEVDTVTRILHFRIGNRHYYANNSNVSVIH